MIYEDNVQDLSRFAAAKSKKRGKEKREQREEGGIGRVVKSYETIPFRVFAKNIEIVSTVESCDKTRLILVRTLMDSEWGDRILPSLPLFPLFLSVRTVLCLRSNY